MERTMDRTDTDKEFFDFVKNIHNAALENGLGKPKLLMNGPQWVWIWRFGDSENADMVKEIELSLNRPSLDAGSAAEIRVSAFSYSSSGCGGGANHLLIVMAKFSSLYGAEKNWLASVLKIARKKALDLKPL